MMLRKLLIAMAVLVFLVCFTAGRCAGRSGETGEPDPTAIPTITPTDGSTPLPTNTPGAPVEPEATPTQDPDDTDFDPDYIGRKEEMYPESLAFKLHIRGETVPVALGVDEATLEMSPGWQTTSAYPGTEGVCVIFGHRNREHLLVLKDIDYGDDITVELNDGTRIRYFVESIRILESDEELLIPMIDGKHMILVTCYPFYYTGHAPQKCVVQAKITE